ncbi:MAG: ABC transporter substrate-binding protein [Candidatus Rokuibacteriota bacterium]
MPRPDSLADDLRWAADFEPADPTLGLRWDDLASDRVTRRGFMRLAIAAGALGAFGRYLGPSSADAQGQPGGELKVGWDIREFANLDPAYMNLAVYFMVGSNIMGGLTHVDTDLVPRGDLATSWEVTPDGRTWTFKLRDGVRWHNGDRFSADDVVYTFERTRDPATASPHRPVLDPIERVAKLDPLTLRFHLKEPRASFLVKITERSSGRALTIVNRRAVQELGKDGHNRQPVGTGPFRIAEHRLGERLVLDRFADYYDRSRPKVDRVTIFNIEEPATLVSALESGQVDLINQVPAALVPRVKANPEIVVAVTDSPGFEPLWFNLCSPAERKATIGKERLPTDDARVRLAMAKAVDRDDLIKRALFGLGVPAYGPVNKAQKQYWRDLAATSPQRYDLPEAKRLMAAAGLAGGFKMKCLAAPAYRRLGEVLTDIYRKALNVELELEIVDFPVWVQRYLKGAFELSLIGSLGDPDPDDSIDDYFKTKAKFNGYCYSNPRVDELNEAQKRTLDVPARARLVHELLEHVARDAPGVFLYHQMDIVAHRKHVRGFAFVPGLRDLDTVTVR